MWCDLPGAFRVAVLSQTEPEFAVGRTSMKHKVIRFDVEAHGRAQKQAPAGKSTEGCHRECFQTPSVHGSQWPSNKNLTRSSILLKFLYVISRINIDTRYSIAAILGLSHTRNPMSLLQVDDSRSFKANPKLNSTQKALGPSARTPSSHRRQASTDSLATRPAT